MTIAELQKRFKKRPNLIGPLDKIPDDKGYIFHSKLLDATLNLSLKLKNPVYRTRRNDVSWISPVFGLCAIAALAFVRPHWRAQLGDISADSVDLVYLDPPLNSPGKLQRSFQGALRRTIGGTN
jgi:hypothetical protein